MKAMILQNTWNKNQGDCIAELNEVRDYLQEIGYEVVSPPLEENGGIWYIREKLAQCSAIFCMKLAAHIPHNQLILMVAESLDMPVLFPSDLQEHKSGSTPAR